MSDTATSSANPEEMQVASAIDSFLSENDPKEMSYEEFRGAQFDHGLAWVYFDKGHGGLGVNPVLQRKVEVETMLTDNLVLEAILFALFIFSMT